jgi:hypothetical protein
MSPHLVVVTKEEIKLMDFKPLDSASVVTRANFNLVQIKDSEYAPIMLDYDEKVTCVVQIHKTGRIFYSSHTGDFTDVTIKELNPMSDGLIGTLMNSIDNMAVSTLGIGFGISNKRLKCVATDDQN